MIVDVGKLTLLGFQASELATCKVGLFSSNTTITAATVLADLTEAAFTGYARVTLGTLSTPTIVAGRGSVEPLSDPLFTNGSAGVNTVFGWFLTNVAADQIIAATNMGSTAIPAGQSLALAVRITDTQE